MPKLSVQPVTGSAFSQARYKINSTFFEALTDFLKASYDQMEKKRWKGFRLLAGDGSTLNLPCSKDIEEEFGVYATTSFGTNRYLARVLFLYDVLNDFVLESQISNMENGEKPLLEASLPTNSKGDEIIILDRGFGNFCMVNALTKGHFQYCIRLSTKSSNFAKRVMNDERVDFETTWSPSEKEKENSRKNQLDIQPIRVRVSKIQLNTGEMELLVSSLCDEQNYSIDDLNELYRLRWGVEEGFKNLKPKMKVEHFGCKKAQGVYQEFYAHIFHINLISLIGMASNQEIEKKTKKRRLAYKYNWKNAFRFVRNKVIDFLHLQEIEDWLGLLVKQVSSSLVAIKPNRSFARDTAALKRKKRTTQFNK